MWADASVKYLLALPTCNKSEISSFDDMINEVVKSGTCLDIFATDGDPMRRKSFCSKLKLLSTTFEPHLYIELSKLLLLDLQFICLSKKAFGIWCCNIINTRLQNIKYCYSK